MGLSYFNIALKGPGQNQVVEHIRSIRHSTYVSPAMEDITVVYPMEGFPPDALGNRGTDYSYRIESDLAPHLSNHFGCTALCAAVSDDDYLWYQLDIASEVIDSYGSDSWYFRSPERLTEKHFDAWPPLGGNAALLCAAFGVPQNMESVENVLRYVNAIAMDDAREIWFGQDRHEYLIRALSLPLFAARMGYYQVEYDDFWFDDVDPGFFIRT